MTDTLISEECRARLPELIKCKKVLVLATDDDVSLKVARVSMSFRDVVTFLDNFNEILCAEMRECAERELHKSKPTVN